VKYHPVELAVARHLGRKPDIHVLIPLEASIKGVIDTGLHVYRNLLVRNWWRLVYGLLRGSNVSMTRTDGYVETMRVAGTYPCSVTYVYFGNGDTPPSWDDYWLSGSATGNGDTVSPNYSETASQAKLEFGRQVNAEGVREVVLYQSAYNTSGYCRNVMYARRVLASEPAVGSTVKHSILIGSPWTRQFMCELYAMLAYTDFGSTVGCKDINGNSFDVRHTAPYGGAVTMYLGTGTAGWSLGDYVLTDAFTIPQQYLSAVESGYLYLTTIGVKRVEADVTIGELGWYNYIYDAGGQKHQCLVNRVVLDSPLTKHANEILSAALTLYVYAGS